MCGSFKEYTPELSVKEKIKREIRKYLETIKNGNTIYQNTWDAAKAVLGGKLIVINAQIKKKERSKGLSTNWKLQNSHWIVRYNIGNIVSNVVITVWCQVGARLTGINSYVIYICLTILYP